MTDNPLNRFNRRSFLMMVSGSIAAASTDGNHVLAGHADLPRPLDSVAQGQVPITSNRDFYVQNYSRSVPDLQRDSWTLTIGGLIQGDPRTLTWRDMQRLPAVESMQTLECIGNPVGGSLVGNALWRGAAFGDLLSHIRIKPEVTRARFTCADGYQTAVELAWLMQPGTLLAYEMNGEALPREHGFPLRLLVPGLYGQKMPKWIKHIEFIDYPFQGYWESRGWSDVAEVQTHAIITHPRKDERISGEVTLQGIAFGGHREIVGVDVRIDQGEWIPAQLVQGESALVWTMWHLEWRPAAPGRYRVEVRATDSSGFTQYEPAGDIFSPARARGSSAIHSITVEIVP